MLQLITRAMRRCATVAATSALALGAVPSQAAVFVTDWDPTFNAAFSGVVGVNVGWKGTAAIDVIGCIAPNASPLYPACGGTATTLSYSLTFYDTGTLLDLFAPVTGAGPALPDPSQVSFDNSSIANGMVLTILSAGPVAIGGFSWDWELDFALAGPTLKLSWTGVGADPCLNSESCAYLYDSTVAPRVTWSVPEPTSILLLGMALAALGFQQRRRACAD
jgi:hypothetical protein